MFSRIWLIRNDLRVKEGRISTEERQNETQWACILAFAWCSGIFRALFSCFVLGFGLACPLCKVSLFNCISLIYLC
jgi:hypothetical protein